MATRGVAASAELGIRAEKMPVEGMQILRSPEEAQQYLGPKHRLEDLDTWIRAGSKREGLMNRIAEQSPKVNGRAPEAAAQLGLNVNELRRQKSYLEALTGGTGVKESIPELHMEKAQEPGLARKTLNVVSAPLRWMWHHPVITTAGAAAVLLMVPQSSAYFESLAGRIPDGKIKDVVLGVIKGARAMNPWAGARAATGLGGTPVL